VAGNSQDLNPIENVWSWMKSQLKDNNYKNMEEWKIDTVRLWTLKMDDSQYLRNLVESIPRRLEEVILRGRGAT
jgi:transposase